jgi:hypothetical protein
MSLSMMPGAAGPRLLAAALIVAGSVLSAPAAVHAQAQPPAEQREDPGTLAREAIDKLMRALSSAIENLPQYAMPELNERGDIIIRRINPRAEKPRPSDNPDETRT